MSGPRSKGHVPFDPNELDAGDPADLADALESASWLEASIDDAPITTGAHFSDRVMAALADEPAPAPAGFLAPLRRRGFIVGFGASIRQAWASIGAPGRPRFARAAALAYVLAIAIAGTSLAGAATITVAGALGILGPHQAEPTLPTPLTSPEPSRQPAVESESPGPDASEEAREGPTASDDHGGDGAEPSHDNGGGSSGPGGSGDHGNGDGGDHATPDPTGGDGGDDHGGSRTPKPGETPRPASTSSDGGSGGETAG